ncbi:hypothetical protein HZA44_04460, partial [Candidatus Peregrinibacteria bacterium]|nr:hypothetical protein [Candidatus Peregrinibacteria bacterium]
MKKSLILSLFCLLILAGCGKFIAPEDDWACTDQGWVKHGNPSAPQPEWACGKNVEPKTTGADGEGTPSDQPTNG